MAGKKTEQKTTEVIPEAAPQTADEFVASGWGHYSKKEFFRAEADFQKALELSPNSYDTEYALGMVLQASNRQPEAIRAFEKTITMLENVPEEERVRAHMLTRLANGHINRMKTGDWKIE